MKMFVPTLAAALLVATGAFAQVEVDDADGDGVYSMDEIAAAFPDMTEDQFAEIDIDESGTIDADELASASEAGLLPAE